MIHYHGTPITPKEKLLDLAGRHFCVSFADPRDVRTCHEIGQSVMLDNGAFTFWNDKTRDHPGWDAYMDWVEPWLDYPTTWAVIPDVIDGDEAANDRLLVQWFARRMPKGAPVWHLHESLDRLRRLAIGYERVCFGSSGAYKDLQTPQWHRRISLAFDTIADERGSVPWVHMLRGMALAGSHYPFASADSASAARNNAGSWRMRPRPITAMVAETDARQCPPPMAPRRRSSLHRKRRMKYLVAAAFVATVYAANWALTTFGVVSIGLGLEAPAGVFFAGLGFLLRDALHELAGRAWVAGAIVAGALLSWLLGADAAIPGGHASIAVASGAAFLLSEFADFAVYTPLRRRTIAGAVALSQVAGAAVDSALFLYLAFGSLAFFWGQFVGKTLLVLPALALLVIWRKART